MIFSISFLWSWSILFWFGKFLVSDLIASDCLWTVQLIQKRFYAFPIGRIPACFHDDDLPDQKTCLSVRRNRASVSSSWHRLGIEDPWSDSTELVDVKLQGIFDRKEVCHFQIRSLTPQQSAGNALAFAVQVDKPQHDCHISYQ